MATFLERLDRRAKELNDLMWGSDDEEYEANNAESE